MNLTFMRDPANSFGAVVSLISLIAIVVLMNLPENERGYRTFVVVDYKCGGEFGLDCTSLLRPLTGPETLQQMVSRTHVPIKGMPVYNNCIDIDGIVCGSHFTTYKPEGTNFDSRFVIEPTE